MRIRWSWKALALPVLLALGCNNDEGPTLSAPIIAKTGTKSGDTQTGPAGSQLPNELRVVVTRDGAPASGVTVTWSTGSGGFLTPSTDQTDGEGVSSSVWTLGATGGSQSADARAEGGGINSTVTFTATATRGGPGDAIQLPSQNP